MVRDSVPTSSFETSSLCKCRLSNIWLSSSCAIYILVWAAVHDPSQLDVAFGVDCIHLHDVWVSQQVVWRWFLSEGAHKTTVTSLKCWWQKLNKIARYKMLHFLMNQWTMLVPCCWPIFPSRTLLCFCLSLHAYHGLTVVAFCKWTVLSLSLSRPI